MKKNITALAVVVSLVLGSALYLNAMISTAFRVNVPFAFQMDKTAFPAGTYIVKLDRASSASALGTIVTLRTLDGKIQLRAVSAPGYYGPRSKAGLTFNRYANSYFLTTVRIEGLGCHLSKSKAEKEIAAKFHPSQRTLAAAE
ncbi:MAG: hypothetical protein EHM18_05025 [Acidobacteria bacterium]|nr:MAG: hypothetical protein EHM18_05025 [Acidobacteriota bacterium]